MHRTCATGNALLIAILLATSISAAAAERDWKVYGWTDFGSTSLHSDPQHYAPNASKEQQPGFGIGVRWISGLSIEAGSTRGLQHSSADSTYFDGLDTVNIHFNYRLDSAFVSMGWTWALGRNWSLTTAGGFHRASSTAVTRVTADARPDAIYTQRDNRHDLTYGIRVDYALNDRWHIGLGVQRFALESLELDRTALRVSYQF